MPGFLNQQVISDDHLIFHNYFSLCHRFICFFFQVTLQPLQPESQPPRPPPTQQKQKQPPQPQTQLHLKQKVCACYLVIQGRKWQLGRVGNCQPSFWQNRRRRRVAAWWQWHATLLLAHQVLGSHLRPCITK